MLDEYYSLRKWSKKGIPTEEKLVELGLLEIVKDMRNMEKKTNDF
jgi:aldehyde:ferredoxin oxidoreductase